MLIPIILGLLAATGVTIVLTGSVGLTRNTGLPSTGRPGIAARYMENLRTDLVEAGVDRLTPGRFLAFSVLVFAVTTALILLVSGAVMIALLGGLFTGSVLLRGRYIGGPARRRRLALVGQVADASREIADILDNSATSATEALTIYARRADSTSEHATGQENMIARALKEAIYQRDSKGAKQESALREASARLGNRYVTTMFETVNQNVNVGNKQLASGLRRVAKEVDYTLDLRRERITYLSAPVGAYKQIGFILAGLSVLTVFVSPTAGDFYASWVGQAALIAGITWWYIGYRITRRHLDERI